MVVQVFNGTKVGADQDINLVGPRIAVGLSVAVLAQTPRSISLTVNYINTLLSKLTDLFSQKYLSIRTEGWMKIRVLFELSHLRLLLEV